jgi:hypothetical protein
VPKLLLPRMKLGIFWGERSNFGLKKSDRGVCGFAWSPEMEGSLLSPLGRLKELKL